MSDHTRPTLTELLADGLTPDLIIEHIDGEKAMAGGCVCNCGIHGDDKEKIEACTSQECYFRENGSGAINAPYLDWPELDATRKHYEGLQKEYEAAEAALKTDVIPRIRPVPSTVTTVDMATGKETTKPMNWGLLPPAAGKCQVCAGEHAPHEPHNAQSLYYQYAFYGATNPQRWPTWADAVAHCSPGMQARWKEELTGHHTGNRWTEPPEGVAPVAHLGEEAKAG
jgi:hypothetical protein